MSKPYKGFCPPWLTDAPKPDTYRSVMKWGDPKKYKVPKEGLYNLIKSKFNLTDDDFKQPKFTGEEEITAEVKSALSDAQIAAFESIVGKEKTSLDSKTRIAVAYGKTMIDILRMRHQIIENVPDLVVYPETTEEVKAIVEYCNNENIALYVYAGGSSVTRGTECMKSPNVLLDLRKNFNKVISFNPVNQTITVQPGMYGPELERILNNAVVELDGAECAYTCGHFPQSFEFSCVGGWVVTRGAGQNSTYYGKIEDIVLSQEYVTPAGGVIKTDTYPRKATGPNIDQIMMGSEGTFGILTQVTLKIFKLSKAHKKFSFMFRNWQDARDAMREVMQGEFGYPSVFRLSDPEETDVMMHMYNIADTPLNTLLVAKGFKENQRCLLLGFCDGESGLQKNVLRNVKRIAKEKNAVSLTGYVTTSWEHGRFSDPYLRDNIQDFGIIIDTLECTVNWDNMEQVHADVRAYVKSRPNTICMTHISHAYPQGANLYFIFIVEDKGLDDFTEYHRGVLAAIQKSGAAMSHHHGIGKLFAPFLEGSIGSENMNVLRALKAYFDPKGILNPGGTLGLDAAVNDEPKA